MEQALKEFERNNLVKSDLFIHDHVEQQQILKKELWKQDPKYFKKCYVSITALIKMVMHAESGGDIEVMGSLQGRIQGNSIVIVDSFQLPVEGTETRVSAQNEGYEYMVKYMSLSEKAGRKENVVGWYHSHPGYGCWLSGIDVATQTLNQTYSEPFCAIVIDPHRTITAGKVEIGCFRTFPEGYTPTESEDQFQSIPLNKIEDFGVHANRYYQLEVEFFKSPIDDILLELLWEKYWINTLSDSNLNSMWRHLDAKVDDLSQKIRNHCQRSKVGVEKDKDPESNIVKESANILQEAANGFLAFELKKKAFQSV